MANTRLERGTHTHRQTVHKNGYYVSMKNGRLAVNSFQINFKHYLFLSGITGLLFGAEVTKVLRLNAEVDVAVVEG